MEKVKSVLLCLVSLMSLVYCDVLDINNVCKLEQTFDFIPKSYSCTFVRGNVYVYQGKPSIETIYFDTFNADSTLIILGVKTIVIKRGSMDTCHQLVTRNPEASIIINEQNCENAEKTVRTSKSTTVSLSTPTTSSMMSVTAALTSSTVTTQTSLTATTQVSSTATTQASSTVTAPVKESDGNSTTAWIISFVLSSVDVVKVSAGAFLAVVGVLIKFRRDLIDLMNDDQLNFQQRQQINVPIPQNIPIPIPQRPQRIRNTPDRYGQWKM